MTLHTKPTEITLEAAVARYKCNSQMLHECIHAGILGFRRNGSTIYFSVAELDEFFSGEEV